MSKRSREFIIKMDIELHGVSCIVVAKDEETARRKAESLDYSDYNDSCASISNLSVTDIKENS